MQPDPGPGFGPWSRLFSELHQTTKSFMTGSKWLQFEEWIFTKKWREACKLPVKVVIFPKSSKRDNPFAVLFRRSPCRGEPYGIDFCEKCLAPKIPPLKKFAKITISATKRVQTRAPGLKLWGSGAVLPRILFRPLPASPGSKI